MEVTRGTIIASSHRKISVFLENGQTVSGNIPKTTTNLVIGDEITCSCGDRCLIIHELFPRKNCLKRTDINRTKQIVANIDLLILVTAPHPLHSINFINRVTVAAITEGIPFIIVVNKKDLGIETIANSVLEYKKIGFEVIETCAIQPNGLKPLIEIIENSNVQQCALCGVSGVGKSTILNKLIPSAQSRVGGLSEKIGQGKQTTSAALGYLYMKNSSYPIIVIDLPGVRKYGLSHLQKEELIIGFPEMLKNSHECRFDDCLHISEPECNVIKAVDSGEIPTSRYNSYLEILSEIRESKRY